MHKIIAIARNTFRESIRSKVLYAFLFFAFFIVIVSTVLSTTTIGDRMKLLKDFGLAILSLATVLFVIVSGSTLLNKELQRRTVFNLLAKPVRRYQFLLGKFLGLLATSVTLLALMGAGLSALLFAFEGTMDLGLLQAYLYMALELTVVCSCVIFFSSVVVTPLLNGLFTFGIFLAGRSVLYLWNFSKDADMPYLLRGFARALYWVFPHLDRLFIANEVVYGALMPLSHVLFSFLYAGAYAAALLTVASAIFNRRNFN